MNGKTLTYAAGLVFALIFFAGVSIAQASETSMVNKTVSDLNDGWYCKGDLHGVEPSDNLKNMLELDCSWQPVLIRDYWTRHLTRHTQAGSILYVNRFFTDNPSRDLALYLAGADNDVSFYLNGELVGTSSGYSDDISFDAGNYLRNGENTFAIRLKRSAGTENIYGPISLLHKPDLLGLLHPDSSYEHARPSVEWVKNAVIYELYPRSFSKDESFKSVISKIHDLKKLGVTVLWLMPIHPVGKVNRKGALGSPYSIRDYYKINPEYGTLEDFKELVKAVHRAGMHIIIDLVINHTAWDNPLINEHPDWYKHDNTGKIIPPNPDWTDVAQLNYANKDLREYMLNMMKYYVKDIGIDGFRCDVAEMVPLDFWDDARSVLDSIKPVMMLAEGSKPDLHLKAFDLTYSWNVYDVLGKIFEGSGPASALDSVLVRDNRVYPKGSLHLRFNTNHDKNAYDGASVKRYGTDGDSLTVALVATLPGVPLIYNGDEVGNPQKLSLFEQVPIDWHSKNSYRSFYEKILSLRSTHEELTDGRFKLLSTGEPQSVVAFEREKGNISSLCIFNFSRMGSLDIDVRVDGRDSGTLVDDLTGREYKIENGVLRLSLGKYHFLILSEKKESL